MDIGDSMRYHLVTQFACAKCGNPLALSYSAPRAAFGDADGDNLTGAVKVVNRIAIHPCRKCYGEAIEPIEALAKAVRAAQAIPP